MKNISSAALVLAFAVCAGAPASAQVNAGDKAPETSLPFVLTPVVTDFKLPWRIAFLPDGRMLVTEKTGALWLVTQKGAKTPVANVPAVHWQGQAGMLGVYLSPHYAQDHYVYLTYAEPNSPDDGLAGLALARAHLNLSGSTASLEGLTVIWRQLPRGKGGQYGAAVAFSPDGNYLFLAVGDRQRMTPAQDPDQPVGKVLRLTLDGKPAPGNPNAGKTGASKITLIDPPRDTEAAKTAPVVSAYTFSGPNLTPSETWAIGFRTPYGLAFGPDGKLYEAEDGPRGGDDFNRIEPGKNYGWPLVRYAPNYDGVPIPDPSTRPDIAKPLIYWTPVIASSSLTFYNGNMFPAWKGTAFVGGLVSKTINHITFNSNDAPVAAERWMVDHRVRDIEVAPDGAIWFVEDASPGGLFRLTPAK